MLPLVLLINLQYCCRLLDPDRSCAETAPYLRGCHSLEPSCHVVFRRHVFVQYMMINLVLQEVNPSLNDFEDPFTDMSADHHKDACKPAHRYNGSPTSPAARRSVCGYPGTVACRGENEALLSLESVQEGPDKRNDMMEAVLVFP